MWMTPKQSRSSTEEVMVSMMYKEWNALMAGTACPAWINENVEYSYDNLWDEKAMPLLYQDFPDVLVKHFSHTTNAIMQHALQQLLDYRAKESKAKEAEAEAEEEEAPAAVIV
jgi:hypothetical protein